MPTGFSNAALLDALGLQQKPGIASRILSAAGFVAAGVVVGGVAALLFAPRTGRQMRQDLRVGAREVGDQVGAVAGVAVDAIKKRSEQKNHGGEPLPLV